MARATRRATCVRAVGARRRGEDRLGAIAIATSAALFLLRGSERERGGGRIGGAQRFFARDFSWVLDLFFPLLVSLLELSDEKDSWKLR